MSYSHSSAGNQIAQRQSGPGTFSPAATPQTPPSKTPEPGRGPSQFLIPYWLLMSIFFCLFLVYLLYLQTRNDVGNNGTLRAISDLFVLFGSVMCTLMCGYATLFLRRSHTALAGLMAGRAWIAWLFLGGSAAMYSIGQLIWTWYDATYASANLPFPATYDFFYLSVYPLSWVGVALLIPRGSSVAGRTRLLLDAGIAVASSLAISWYFILGPTIASLSGEPIAKVVALAYPLGDLSLCISAALLLFGPSGSTVINNSIIRLAIGVACLAVTDSLYGYLQLQGIYHTGLLQDIGWPMSWLFIGWAALVYPASLARLAGQKLPDEQLARPSRLNTVGATLRAVTPMVLAILTCAVLLLEATLSRTAPLIQIVFVCAGLFLLPVVRQALTLVDNLLLNERLRTALDQSQQAFQQSQQELISTSTRAEQYDELRAGIENLQAVHARLARGDLGARAIVKGPLSPVAQSLNLLIDRMSRWAQLAQTNRVLEDEANQIRQHLQTLNEGHLLSAPPASRSPYSTGAVLLAIAQLQNQLNQRFERLRETLGQMSKRWSAVSSLTRRTEQSLRQNVSTQPSTLAVQQALTEMQKEFANGEPLLQELWRQVNVYEPEEPQI